MDLVQAVAQEVGRRTDDIVDVRRALHLRPELSFEEVQTTALVRERLGGLGASLRPCPTPTGAVATLEGGRPGATVLLRADIDALPVDERSGVPFTSTVEGKMHACGHDAHTAVLLAVAASLADLAEGLPGRYVFVFQPAEERVSGAKAMVDGGLVDDHRPDAALGLHFFTGAPTGILGTRPGVAMAGAYGLRVLVTGSGGHGALQPRLGNVVLAASRIADRLHTVVDGMATDGAHCVCSPGMIVAGTAPNVVPTRAELAATLRWFDEAQRDDAMRRVDALAAEVAAEFEVEVMVEDVFRTGPVRNDPEVTDTVLDVAGSLLPEQAVVRLPAPFAASDDMSVFLERVPGCYLMVGAAAPDGTCGVHHSPSFAIDEGAMAIGASVLAASAVRLASALAPG